MTFADSTKWHANSIFYDYRSQTGCEIDTNSQRNIFGRVFYNITNLIDFCPLKNGECGPDCSMYMFYDKKKHHYRIKCKCSKHAITHKLGIFELWRRKPVIIHR